MHCNHLCLGTILNSTGCRRAHSGDTQGLHLGIPGPPSTPWLRPISVICHWPRAAQCPVCSGSGPALADVAISSTAVPIRNNFSILIHLPFCFLSSPPEWITAVYVAERIARRALSRGRAGIATARAAIAPSPSVGSFDVDLIMDFPRHPGVREENEEINRVLSDVFIGRFVHDLRDGNLVLIALCADVFFWIP